MVDHHRSGDKDQQQDKQDAGFESLQSQLDAFMEQEKAALADSGQSQGSVELQERLDHFIDNLQNQLDSFMDENPADKKSGKSGITEARKPEPIRKQEKPASSSAIVTPPPPRQAPVALQPNAKPESAAANHSSSYSGLISRVLIAAAIVTATVLWFAWPTGPVSPPEDPVTAEQAMDEKLPLLSMEKEPSAPIEPAIETEKPVEAEPTTAPEPVVQQTTPSIPATQSADNRLTVTASIGNIRSAPDTSGKVLFRLKRGAIVTRLSEQGDWYEVRLRNGTIAWAHRSVFE